MIPKADPKGYEERRKLLYDDPKQLKIENFYMNNSSALRQIVCNDIPYDVPQVLENTGGLGKDTTVTIRRIGHLPGDGPQFTYFDKVVLDSVYTLIQNGYHSASIQMITKVVYGDLNKKAKKSQEEKVLKSIRKWQQVVVELSCDDELRSRGYTEILFEEDGEETNMMIRDVMMIDREGKRKAANGRETLVFALDKNILYLYAEALTQFICIKFADRTLNFTDSEEKKASKIDEEVVVLRDYVITRFETMKNPYSSLKSTKISYLWYDMFTKEEKGMFKELKIKKENYANWKFKKYKIHLTIGKILNHFKKLGYIINYETFNRKVEGKDKPVINGWILEIEKKKKTKKGKTKDEENNDEWYLEELEESNE